MPSPLVFDLATSHPWAGCRPGISRSQTLAALQSANLEAEPWHEHNLTVTDEQWELELEFSRDGSERLHQLSLEGEAVLWNGRRLMGLSLDEALQTIAPNGPALWTKGDASAEPFGPAAAPPGQPATDAELLQEGTVWLAERELGLVIWEGVATWIVWRAGQDLPQSFAGPVTAEQRALSRRPDLDAFLRHEQSAHAARTAQAAPKGPWRFLRSSITLAALVALGFTIRDGLRDAQIWSLAPTTQGWLVAMERGPAKQFIEYLPAVVTAHFPRWLVAGSWPRKPVETDLYRIAFADSAGQWQELLLESADFYVPPQKLGEAVDLLVAPGEPLRVRGPSRARDAAFIDHMPWAIAIGAAWLAAQACAGILPWLWRRFGPVVWRAVLPRNVIEVDRPEAL